jgi:5-hydroxyisourate hydrolase
MSLSTHVLDAVRGKPAAGIGVRLEAAADDGWMPLATVRTGADGRVRDGLSEHVTKGPHRLVFDTAAYFADQELFYPEVAICFSIADPAAHYHVPLLISPFAYSTYRGS